jgi:hypothetical protein
MAMPEKMAQLIATKLTGENIIEENLSCRASTLSSRHSPQQKKGYRTMRPLSKGACIDGNLAQNVCILKTRYIIVWLLVLLFWGCDNGSTDAEPNDSSDANVSLAPEVAVPEIVSSPEAPPPSTPSLPVPPLKPPLPIPVVPEGPQNPAFTEELLASVKNWTAVPPSVFPLSGVTLKQPLNFEIKTPSGQVVGNSPRAVGDEVVALGLVGNQLHVSPSKTSKQQNVLSVDETDFKTCVAYLFEVRKRQYKAHDAELARKSSVPSSRPSPTSNPLATKPYPPPLRNSSGGRGTLFEDIPPPMDFGHGKFCICRDCRTKRKDAQK